jgi:hypothetical protein
MDFRPKMKIELFDVVQQTHQICPYPIVFSALINCKKKFFCSLENKNASNSIVADAM